MARTLSSQGHQIRIRYAEFLFIYLFKFYVLMQPKTMKHDAIYLNSSIVALCVC